MAHQRLHVRWIIVAATAFCAASWVGGGDAAYRLLHEGRGPGLTRVAKLLIKAPVHLIEKLASLDTA